MKKLTEDETITHLMQHLKSNGWEINNHCLGQTRGCDIVAIKDGITQYIEVKGARASDNSPTKKREYFNNGQIKTHFGKAIVKMLDDKFQHLEKEAKFAIAHPNDPAIKKAIGNLTPMLKRMEIQHYWISENGAVTQD